jgi:hypothetical protein
MDDPTAMDVSGLMKCDELQDAEKLRESTPEIRYTQAIGRGKRVPGPVLVLDMFAPRQLQHVYYPDETANVYAHLAHLIYGRKRCINVWAYMDNELSAHMNRYQGSVPATYNAVTEYNLRITCKALNEQIAMFDRFIKDVENNLK